MVKNCKHCDVVIPKTTKQWKNKIFCSTRCRKNNHRRLKSESGVTTRREANLLKNDEFAYLIRQCRYAGTVQVLSYHDLDSFTKTMNLIKARPAGHVHLCHIAPVKGEGSIGLLHHLNLFYGGDHQNIKFRNCYLGGGLKIEQSSLERQWDVSRNLTNQEVMDKVRRFLGGIFVCYINRNPVRKSKKHQLAKKILQFNSYCVYEDLLSLSHTELRRLWAKTSHQQVYIPNKCYESKFIAYMDSLARFVDVNHPRSRIFKKLLKILALAYLALERIEASDTFNKDFDDKYGMLVDWDHAQVMLIDHNEWSEFKDLVYDTAFETLQGRGLSIPKFREKVMAYLHFPRMAWRVPLAPWQYRMRYEDVMNSDNVRVRNKYV